MSETHAAVWHSNQQLFSDYFLNVKLPGFAEWRALAGEAEAVREKVAAIFAAYVPSANEAQVEEGLVRPVLRALGHEFEVQPALETPDGTKRPDYVLYADAASVTTMKDKKLDDGLLRTVAARAVADAKAWDRSLDMAVREKAKSAADLFTNKNPSYQIAFYIQHSGLEWGVLTNGRLWRLYHRDTAHKLNRFYEVDLPRVLDGARDGDADAFLYFYAFFRSGAFEAADALSAGRVLRESEISARGVGDALKRQVFTALRHLAQGFLDYAPNALSVDDPDTRRALYDNSLILLYRLLFVLYAEAREMLPVREATYREEFSLLEMKRRFAAEIDAERAASPSTARRWGTIKELFRIIDQGDEPLKVTTYNGGLFDPARHPFLERYAVGDRHLRAAVDQLTRVADPMATGERVFVDYRDLSERHLGTIYEGLLEFHLEADATEPGWSVALKNDKGERKATGSYYTPDYIVKYIVARTVGPMLEAAIRGKEDDAEKIAAVLGVNVLDPAMGSGHFLVEATEFIARFLVDLGVAPDTETAPGEADVAYWKRRVVHSCIYGVDLNPLAVDLAKLSLWLSTLASDRPLSFLDHHLRPGNALVGARLSDLQLEDKAQERRRAKAAREAAKLAAAGQVSLLSDEDFRQSLGAAVGSMAAIERSEARTVAEVKEQERLYASLRETLTARYGRLANLSCARHFGLRFEEALWSQVSRYAGGKLLTAPPQFEAWLSAADALAGEPDKRFFHWELEFPEVFFDAAGRPLGDAAGFDAVVGNPPYVEQEKLKAFKPFFADRYADIYAGTADLYLYFFGQGVRQLQRGGRMAYITSGTFARANFAAGFRRTFPTVARLDTIIDFGENQPFDGAEMVRPSIVVLEQGTQGTDPFRSLFLSEKVPSSLDAALETEGIDCDPSALEQPEWVFQSAELTHLFQKVQAAGEPLSEAVNGRMYRGVLTGLNDAFI